jgi:nitrous oxide reductase accessory protein NosL
MQSRQPAFAEGYGGHEMPLPQVIRCAAKPIGLGFFKILRYQLKTKAIIFLLMLMPVSPLWADEMKPLKPGPKDKCPVCGMFVAKYPDWVAGITFSDGSTVLFDGVKDMMKYYFNMPKYAPGKKAGDIQAIHVTDYYRLEHIIGRSAFFVAGSDVYGPMGKELIPFEKEAEAQEFMKDHKGKTVLRFDQIDLPLVMGLD